MADIAIGDESVLIRALARWRERPDLFVREALGAIPDLWQEDVLQKLPTHPQIAMSCCKGPGKTCVLAWIAWWHMMTRELGKILVLSVTGATLTDTLWSELSRWYSTAPVLQRFFRMTSERVIVKEEGKENQRYIAARSFPRNANPQEQAAALAGFHGTQAMVILDEANGMPRSVLATVAPVRSEGLPDQRIVIAGNPTNQDSALGQAIINERQYWLPVEVTADPDDPKRTPRVNAEHARQQIAIHGRDNPWVLCNIFGRFPPGGLNTLISADEVLQAQRRNLIESDYKDYPLIFGVDVARFGDDETVIFPRRGKIAYPPLRMRNRDTVFVASHLSRVSNERGADSVQIDATGSAGVYDVYRNGLAQKNALAVQFGGSASADTKYVNKRAEIWHVMCEAIRQEGVALPPDVPEMVRGLSETRYGYDRLGRIQIEDKDIIKAKIGRSPDLEDALACTWAYPVAIAPKTISGLPQNLTSLIGQSMHVNGTSYDPFQRYADEAKREYG
jgi:phage terminase large subunit